MTIPRPNTIPIPNVIFDHWMKELDENEFVILFILTAETYIDPFKENGVEICETDLLKKCGIGMDLCMVKKAIEYLEDQGLIRIEKSTKDNSNQCNIYHLTDNLFYPKEKGVKI